MKLVRLVIDCAISDAQDIVIDLRSIKAGLSIDFRIVLIGLTLSESLHFLHILLLHDVSQLEFLEEAS